MLSAMLESLKFGGLGHRFASLLLLTALTAYFFVRPLWRRVSDQQVALYLEEHEPSLDTAILSAVSAGSDRSTESVSPALMRRLIESALERCAAVQAGRGLETTPLRRYSTVLTTTALATIALFVLGPVYLRQGASALLRISGNVEAASPYRIEVQPGSTAVPRGSDQVIAAKLIGFESDKAELLIRKAVNAPFEPVPMVLSDSATTYEGMLLIWRGRLTTSSSLGV